MKIYLDEWIIKDENCDYSIIGCFTESYQLEHDLSLNVGIQIDKKYPIQLGKYYEVALKFVCQYSLKDNIIVYESTEDYYKNARNRLPSENIMPILVYLIFTMVQS